MSASIWAGSTNVASTANADNTYKQQKFLGSEGTVVSGNTVFTLTTFTYALGTGSLDIYINGVHQDVTEDFTETSISSVTIIGLLEAADEVLIRGLVGSTGATTANEAATAATASAAAAAASAVESSGYADDASTSADEAAASAILADNSADAAAVSAAEAALYASGISIQATDFTQDTATTAGLTYGYKAGVIRSDTVTTAVAAGTIVLTDNATNYLQVTGAGVLSDNTSGFSSGQFPIATIVTAGGVIGAITDKRGIIAVAPPGSEKILQTGTVSAVTSIDITGFRDDALYDDYILELKKLFPVNNNIDLYIYYSSDNGATFALAGNYGYKIGGAVSGPFTYISTCDGGNLLRNIAAGSARAGATAVIRMTNPSSARYMSTLWEIGHDINGSSVHKVSGAALSDAGAGLTINAIRIACASGNIDSAMYKLTGRRKS